MTIEYSVRVDGFEIDRIEIPKMPQRERDKVRSKIAADRSVPRHYIKLHPLTKTKGYIDHG